MSAAPPPRRSSGAHVTPGMMSAAKARLWAGRVLTVIPALFLLFDGVSHALLLPQVVETSAQLGYPSDLMRPLGIVELLCLGLYLVPRSALLGAILLTGYLGGAVATHVRVGNPLFGYQLFPVYVGLLLWGGLYLRDARLRALLPLRSAT